MSNSTHYIEAEILTNHQIRKTPFRLNLISMFLKNSSLTTNVIIKNMEYSPDKVTIYRALESFEKNGLIHKVPDANNTFRYALCKVDRTENSHQHNHIHFICKECKDTFCVPDGRIPKITLPDGFFLQESKIISSGFALHATIHNELHFFS